MPKNDGTNTVAEIPKVQESAKSATQQINNKGEFMPCDSTTSIGVDLGKLDAGPLMRGLTADKLSPIQRGDLIHWTANGANGAKHTYNTKTGQLEINSRRTANTDTTAAGIKQSFGRQLVRDQAKRYGWQIHEHGNKFTVTKRTL